MLTPEAPSVTTVLGIDGGGTCTRLVLANTRGSVLAALEAPSIHLDDHPEEHAIRVLAEAVTRLRHLAGRDDANVDAAFLSMGGVLTERDQEAVRAVAVAAGIAKRERIAVHHDAYGALEGGLLGREGMLLVAGTGSVCFGRTEGGREARCGNWGPLLGDEGSGHWLGREALRAVAHAHDGRGRPTALTQTICSELGIDDPDELLHRIHLPDFGRAAVASLAPTVLHLVDRHDGESMRILARGCALLATCVRVVSDELFPSRGAPLVMTGGLTTNRTYTDALESHIARSAPGARIVEPALPPVLGAVRLAIQMVGTRHQAAVDARLIEAAVTM